MKMEIDIMIKDGSSRLIDKSLDIFVSDLWVVTTRLLRVTRFSDDVFARLTGARDFSEIIANTQGPVYLSYR